MKETKDFIPGKTRETVFLHGKPQKKCMKNCFEILLKFFFIFLVKQIAPKNHKETLYARKTLGLQEQAGTGPSRRHIQGSKIAKRLPSVMYSFTVVENRKFFEFFFEKITY